MNIGFQLDPAYRNGKCVDESTEPEWWFADDNATQAFAKMICETCPVVQDCLKTALTENIRYGVWGGLDPDQRNTLARKTARLKSSNKKG